MAEQELGPAGKALVTRFTDEFDLEEREIAILHAAAHQADDIRALEASIERDGVTVAGSQGQPRLNQAVTEVRQARVALARLLGQLNLPDPVSEKPESHTTLRARKAAEARWKRSRSKKERLRG